MPAYLPIENKPIEVVTSESGDWVLIRVGKKTVHDHHSISNSDFCCILRELGFTVKETEVADNDSFIDELED